MISFALGIALAPLYRIPAETTYRSEGINLVYILLFPGAFMGVAAPSHVAS
jgi:hypothetical protein